MTAEQEERAIILASEGKSRREILETLEITSHLFSAHRLRQPAFNQRFARAEQDGLELLADDLKTVHEKYADVQRGRLVSDNSKFLLSKRIPHVYGDRIDVNVTERVDVTGALLEARKRSSVPICDQTEQDETQAVEYWEVPGTGTTGCEPDDPPDLDDLLE